MCSSDLTDLEIATGGELVEVVARDVGMHVELLGDLRRGDASLTFTGKEVDRAPGGIPEGGRDGRDRGGERTRGEVGGLARHIGILPMVIVEIIGALNVYPHHRHDH